MAMNLPFNEAQPIALYTVIDYGVMCLYNIHITIYPLLFIDLIHVYVRTYTYYNFVKFCLYEACVSVLIVAHLAGWRSLGVRIFRISVLPFRREVSLTRTLTLESYFSPNVSVQCRPEIH